MMTAKTEFLWFAQIIANHLREREREIIDEVSDFKRENKIEYPDNRSSCSFFLNMSHWIFSLLTMFHFLSLFSEISSTPPKRLVTVKTVQVIQPKPIVQVDKASKEDYDENDLAQHDSEDDNQIDVEEALKVKKMIMVAPKSTVNSSAAGHLSSILPIGFVFLFLRFASCSWK